MVRVECEDIEPPQCYKAVVRIDFKAPQFGYSHTHTFEAGCGSVATGTYIKFI